MLYYTFYIYKHVYLYTVCIYVCVRVCVCVCVCVDDLYCDVRPGSGASFGKKYSHPRALFLWTE